MTLGRSRRVVAPLAVTAAVLTATPAAGIAPGGGNEDLARIARAGDELAKAGSAKFRGTATAGGGGEDSEVTFDGAFNFRNRAARYSVDVAALGLQGTGKVRARLVGGVLYLSLDALRARASASMPQLEGKEWLKLDPELFGQGQIGQSDPNGSLDALRGAASDVERVGTEEVRGTRATHYRVTIDVEQAIANAPEDQREVVRGSVAALGSGTIPADVWVDGKGRLRKMRLRVSGSLTGATGTVGFEYFDLGARASVKEPPAGEVVDFLELLGGGLMTAPTTTPPSG
jgi:hypothetical protein